MERPRSLSRVGLVHESDFTRNGGPFQFTAKRLVATHALILLPFEEFITKHD